MEERRDLVEVKSFSPKKVDEKKINKLASRLREGMQETTRQSLRGEMDHKHNEQILNFFFFEEQKVWEYLDHGPWFWPVFA